MAKVKRDKRDLSAIAKKIRQNLNVIFLNGLADLLGIELLELYNGQLIKDNIKLNQRKILSKNKKKL